MNATVIVPTYNRKELLAACLLSLDVQSLNNTDSYEVIVVDDGSTDGTGDMVRALGLSDRVHYHYKPRTPASGLAAARNEGVARSTGDILIFLDGDHVVPATFVNEHLRCHADRDDVAVIGYRIHLKDGDIDTNSLRRGFSLTAVPEVFKPELRFAIADIFSDNMANMSSAWHLCFGCNMSVHRATFAKAGGFDEGFQGWGLEDCEMGYRLKKSGAKFVLARRAVVYHLYHSVAPGAVKLDQWRKNYDRFCAKHPGIEVKLQEILFPRGQGSTVSWFDAFIRFENAIRALEGRRVSGTFTVVRIGRDGEDPDPWKVLSYGDGSNLAILDEREWGRGNFDIAVQLLPVDREVQYFRIPDIDRAVGVYRRLAHAGISREVEAAKW
jgi:glycosyltransferase involved in cell wall biosynthesis